MVTRRAVSAWPRPGRRKRRPYEIKTRRSYLVGEGHARLPYAAPRIDESEQIRGPEWPIHREETEAILMALADLIVDVGIIRALLEDEDEEEEEDA